eukprot:SAG31_NODE_10249_length_1164_cov_3.724883_2_plen_95_part_00
MPVCQFVARGGDQSFSVALPHPAFSLASIYRIRHIRHIRRNFRVRYFYGLLPCVHVLSIATAALQPSPTCRHYRCRVYRPLNGVPGLLHVVASH